MTILCDLSQIISATVFMGDAHECAKHASEASKNMIKHSVFNSIRANYMAHKGTYGKMILACDDSSWRYDVFPQYKHSRKLKRASDKSGIDWEFVDSVKYELIADLDEYFPFPVIKIRKVEGDDIIGVLTKYITELEEEGEDVNIFGDVEAESILIISSDGDNFQLHKYKNVKQWSPMAKKLVRPEMDIKELMIEKFVKGEVGDGIPNIICSDNHYVNPPEKRLILTAKKKALLVEAIKKGEIKNLPEYPNFLRNTKLISYERIPSEYQDLIISVYKEKTDQKISKMKLMNYFIQHGMKNLLSQVTDFY